MAASAGPDGPAGVIHQGFDFAAEAQPVCASAIFIVAHFAALGAV